jgi:succinate dehydrogenase/fumarate reductase flavoprotein subunit
MIDLKTEYLEIAVCAQHCNGGVSVDENWESTVNGLYAAGEAAGTFGVYRPGGSALNSTQVGSLRAAEHIAKKDTRNISQPMFKLPNIKYGKSNLNEIRNEYQSAMSSFADFNRSLYQMKELFERVKAICDNFFDTAVIKNDTQISELYKLYDMLLSQRETLSAMILSAEYVGTHGSAIIDHAKYSIKDKSDFRVMTVDSSSYVEKVSPLPTPELWFETVFARHKNIT